METGLDYHPNLLDRPQQEALVEALRSAVVESPLFTPVMPRTGRPFSVRMTNLGPLGWVSDRRGYRYQPLHPETAKPWAPMPPAILEIWVKVAKFQYPPDACLVNFYQHGAKMGLHQDKDEEDFSAPVVSISLGDTAVFRFGGTTRGGTTQTLKLASGDVVVMGGASRLCFHGIDRVIAGTSTLLKEAGRINLTLRRVTQANPA